MNANRIVLAALCVLTTALTFNQWRLYQTMTQLSAIPANPTANVGAEAADEKLRQAEARLNEAKVQLDIAEQKLASANAQIAQINNRLRQLEATPPRPRFPGGFAPAGVVDDTAPLPPGTKRAWGPEQATGEPDTFQAGDISTAWASLEQDGGEEWLKLEYEKSVDIAEIRVRETHNPGAISKVTAFLANGTELTLWEGVEPQATAPVEMSFQVPDTVNAKSVKVYLDTKRVPGWNEIDAVELIGRDGSHQWAKQASASSTYAQPRGQRLIEREVLRLERL
jgi:hypothetical protein